MKSKALSLIANVLQLHNFEVEVNSKSSIIVDLSAFEGGKDKAFAVLCKLKIMSKPVAFTVVKGRALTFKLVNQRTFLEINDVTDRYEILCEEVTSAGYEYEPIVNMVNFINAQPVLKVITPTDSTKQEVLDKLNMSIIRKYKRVVDTRYSEDVQLFFVGHGWAIAVSTSTSSVIVSAVDVLGARYVK